MTPDFASLSDADLEAVSADATARYRAFAARGLKLDVTRGKPAPEQLDLSNALLDGLGRDGAISEDGADCRNYYGGVQGMPEARRLFSSMMGAPPEQMIAAGNSSLALMHDALVYALLRGVGGDHAPWLETAGAPAFLCPVPGYDRHFAICESFGVRMIPVPLTGHGPDLAEVERLAADPAVKGMWCVPKYSNPTGETYSADAVRGLAAMRTAAPDFRLFWDNAYSVHTLTETVREIPNILTECGRAGYPDRPLVFGSTSKITFAGAGIALLASSPANVRWYAEKMSLRTIGPDKLNQLRHVKLLRDHAGILSHMAAQRRLLAPKFDAVRTVFETELVGTGATWSSPDGGYFVSLDVRPRTAKRVVVLAGQAGIAMVPAGATFPLGLDPRDANLRLAPSFPPVGEVRLAAEGIALCARLAIVDHIRASRGNPTLETSDAKA